MTLYKYHGAGNDFILADNRNQTFPNNPDTIELLCHRRFGIGADGLILLENDSDTDFYMRYFNADGYEGTMCGNGGRCVVAFAQKLGIIKDTTVFNSVDGLHEASIRYNEPTSVVKLKMGNVSNVISANGYYELNTGSRHYVQLVDDLSKVDIVNEGRKIRHSAAFAPEGINVNFIELQNNSILIGTFERGVEDETLACGTGAIAAAIASYLHSNLQEPANYTLQAKGGKLMVCFDKPQNGVFTNIWLEGPAAYVFETEIAL